MYFYVYSYAQKKTEQTSDRIPKHKSNMQTRVTLSFSIFISQQLYVRT